VETLAFRRLLADCLTFSLHRVVALAHNLDFTRSSFSESPSCGGPLDLTNFFSKSFRSSFLRFRLHRRKRVMKTAMSAASTRDNESMRVVRMAFCSDGLGQPGGRNSVSLAGDGVRLLARSSTGVVPVVL